jgi:sulfide:quinone oxidoreductase
MTSGQPHVVIAGGGVAALEAQIALRELAGDRVRVTLVAPQPDFVYRPMVVAAPFCLGHAARHPLGEIARELGARLVHDAVAAVDPGSGRVTGAKGTRLDYDPLLVARRREPGLGTLVSVSAAGAEHVRAHRRPARITRADHG